MPKTIYRMNLDAKTVDLASEAEIFNKTSFEYFELVVVFINDDLFYKQEADEYLIFAW